MIYDLQKAMIWKRISAWLFDAILLSIAAVGIGFCLSALLGYDSYGEIMQQRCQAIEQEYGVSFQISQNAFNRLSSQKQQDFLNANDALSHDGEARKAYAMMVNLSILIVSLSLLSATVLLEFLVPLLLGNGQTLGKKIFSIGVMDTTGIRVRKIQMFIRTVLGKYTIELMIPILVGTLSFWGSLGVYGTMLVVGLLILQLILLAATRTNALIHDLLAGTVVIDMPSQMIFENQAEMLAYKESLQKEMESRQNV